MAIEGKTLRKGRNTEMFSINDVSAFFSQLEIACADFDDFVCGSRLSVCLFVCDGCAL